MFKRVLIANRGEIAIRIARAAASLGVDSVGDLHAGPMRCRCTPSSRARRGRSAAMRCAAISTSRRSSPRPRPAAAIASIPATASCRRTPLFAERCKAEGLRFIGPSPASLELFGDKVAARDFAQVAGHPGRSRQRRSARLERRGQGEGQGHRLSGDAEGLGRRRRARHARRDQAGGDGRGLRALPERGRGRVRRSAPSSWRRSCRGRATSRSRCWPTARATSCTSSSATARCSCATRRSSRSRRRPTSTTACASASSPTP